MSEASEVTKLRFFGDGEAFGDGGAWVYLGDDDESVSEAVASWAADVIAGTHSEDVCEIKTKLMTDAEVAALPDI